LQRQDANKFGLRVVHSHAFDGYFVKNYLTRNLLDYGGGAVFSICDCRLKKTLFLRSLIALLTPQNDSQH